MRLFWLCVALLSAVATLMCGAGANNPTPDERMRARNVEIVLLCKTPHVRAGKTVVLWLAVCNRGLTPFPIDGRMGWPGNIFLWVQAPGSSCESGAERSRPKIVGPRKADLVTVQPRCFYGVEMVVGPDSRAPLVPALRTLRHGRYTFRVVYYSPDVPSLGIEGFEASSNKVSVVVD